ncbi:hypothetical protein Ahy_A05g025494 [Arachis hypogaea]|uniref:Aminotransferase-like plant mobile domain-containing protein n=1 Tax=Arachis hypogaea TaxID=3818 RepID=A0A445D8V2_ARAHY|nr:hypothetical protein Ahy_A05g025494 [Arachis hypogaea]
MTASSSHAAAQHKDKRPCGRATSSFGPSCVESIIDDPQLQINDTRILIPFTVGGDVHCFIGPIETLERANKKLPFFPSVQGEDLFINQALDISFFINQKPFRNNPKINPRGTDFTAWHQRLAPIKSAACRALGIQDHVRLSHFSHSTLPWMIGAVTCFWNRTTNNFHLPCGVIGICYYKTPNKSSKLHFRHTTQTPIQYCPTTSYNDFMAHHMGAEGTAVTDDEHVAFLFYWLNAIVFCSRSVQMSKFFLPLAALLHEGNNLNLAKLLLRHVFEELGQFVNCLRNIYLISKGGPLWLFQLWLNAIFEKYITKFGGGATDKQHIEGFSIG